MKKLILFLILIAVVFYAASLRYAVKSGKSPDGAYKMVLVDKKTGEIKQLWGK